jgi:hypothetical protein
MGLRDRVNIEDRGKWNDAHSTVRAEYKEGLTSIMFKINPHLQIPPDYHRNTSTILKQFQTTQELVHQHSSTT